MPSRNFDSSGIQIVHDCAYMYCEVCTWWLIGGNLCQSNCLEVIELVMLHHIVSCLPKDQGHGNLVLEQNLVLRTTKLGGLQ